MLILLSLLWGGSFFFSKVALAELRPFSIVLGRVGLAALTLNLLVLATGQRMPADPYFHSLPSLKKQNKYKKMYTARIFLMEESVGGFNRYYFILYLVKLCNGIGL